MTPPDPLTAKDVAKWALANKSSARMVGKQIFDFQFDHEGLKEQPTIGEFEDAVISWAIVNPQKARMLMLRLASKLLD